MAGTAYHMEALRKTRVNERKSEAMRRLKDSLGQSGETADIQNTKEPPLVFSEPGHYAQSRCGNIEPSREKNDVVFEEVVHDPNFKYRLLKDSGLAPLHVDPIYSIMYPGGVSRKLTYYRIGPERDMRQYDHSRDGPIVDRSRYNLKREFNFLGNSLSMLKGDIIPEHKPMPMCRRF